MAIIKNKGGRITFIKVYKQYLIIYNKTHSQIPLALLANTPAKPESQQHSLEGAAGGIGLNVKADETEYMCFNQRSDIATQKGGPLKLMDKFTYIGSSVSSTKNDINTRLVNSWTAIYRLSVIWESDLTDKIKRSF